MGFAAAVSTAFSKYATFTGRAGRPEFWWFFLFNLIVTMVVSALDRLIFGHELLIFIAALVVVLPYMAVSVRRLHDTGRSGWWLLLGLVPLVGTIVLLYWYASAGTPATNEYGPPA